MITNRAEISNDNASSYTDENGNPVTDIDSIPDTDMSNDNQPSGAGEPTDDMIGQDGTNGGDEDDHDPASITSTAPKSS